MRNFGCNRWHHRLDSRWACGRLTSLHHAEIQEGHGVAIAKQLPVGIGVVRSGSAVLQAAVHPNWTHDIGFECEGFDGL